MKLLGRGGLLALSLAVVLGSLGAAPRAQLNAKVTEDVQEAFHLLLSVPFQPIPAQRLLDVARHALEARAKERGVILSLFPVTSTTTDADAAALDDEIETIATITNDRATLDAYVALRAMAKAFHDPYTVFWDPVQMAAFEHELDPARVISVGLELRRLSGVLRVSYVVPKTPAQRAGIVVGDGVMAIDGATTKGLDPQAALTRLSGSVGSPVTLTLDRLAGGKPSQVTLQRAEYRPPTVTSEMLPNHIGYIAISAFGETTPNEFVTALHSVIGSGAHGLVLDLRDDGGGFVTSAVDIASQFLGRKPLMIVEKRGRAPATILGENDAPVDLPLVVLVNRNTASASEIAAGALQDNHVAELVGTQTFGKGVMQELDPLRDGSGLKITTAHYLTPLHRDINKRGLSPNVRVPGGFVIGDGYLARDPQLREAMRILLAQMVARRP
ncbi:MAG TPA: S41 family peptidase [Candidatus Dormibacteraeota bacterium]|nr:S41 family peptidase [Candidatus Dormibacteraeota bacterium]